MNTRNRKRQDPVATPWAPASRRANHTDPKLFEAGADVFRLNIPMAAHERNPRPARVDPQGRTPDIGRSDRHPGRPAGAETALRRIRQRRGAHAQERRLLPLPTSMTRRATRHRRVPTAAPRDLRGARTRRAASGERRPKVAAARRTIAARISPNARCSRRAVSNRQGRERAPTLCCRWRPLSEKDLSDLEFVCALGVDWLALSFVQRAADVTEARAPGQGPRRDHVEDREARGGQGLRGNPSASRTASMVARGRSGGGTAGEERAARSRKSGWCASAGRREARDRSHADLESMIDSRDAYHAPRSRTWATASLRRGGAVMLSAESARGVVPVEAVQTSQQTVALEVRTTRISATPWWLAQRQAQLDRRRHVVRCARDRRDGGYQGRSAAFTQSWPATGHWWRRRNRPRVPILALTPIVRRWRADVG